MPQPPRHRGRRGQLRRTHVPGHEAQALGQGGLGKGLSDIAALNTLGEDYHLMLSSVFLHLVTCLFGVKSSFPELLCCFL